MQGSMCLVGLILLFTTLTDGSAFRHSQRKQLKKRKSLPSFKADAEGVLITGGNWPIDTTAELYLPSSDASCSLPTIPDARRSHTADQGFLCGGIFTGDSCLLWSPDTGSWEAVFWLDERRSSHIFWNPTNGSAAFLMGGYWGSERTTTMLSGVDGSQEPGFSLEYDAYHACAIPDPVTDTLVVTGGEDSLNTVVRYGQQGWLEDLPDLITGRYLHACSSYVSSGSVMFLVTGGYADGKDRLGLDSTETFDPMLGSWAASEAKLPQPMSSLSAANINDRVLIFGGWDEDYKNHDDILQYDPEEDKLIPVGHMIKERSFHAVSVVKADDYLQWCQ